MLFDTHAHYDDAAFDPDRELLLESLPQRGVALVLNPGCDLDSSRKAVSYAAAYPHVYAAVGIHPENCAGFVPADIDVLRELARQPKVAAIGEIGLDYYWAENPSRKLQQQVLRAQLALARALRLPVIFHDREDPRGLAGHRSGVPRCYRRVPLLLRQPGDGAGAAGPGLVPGLRRPCDLQKRPPRSGGGRRHAPGPYAHRDG